MSVGCSLLPGFLFDRIKEGDTIEYENYVIYQCPTQSDIVKSVLAHLKVFLPVVIEELEGGEPLGTAPYRAFFGTEFSGPAADPNAVKKIFSLILDGKSIRKYGVEYQPTIVCVTSENYWEFSSAWELCQRAITAMWAVESEVVVLCPGFFASLKLSPSSDDCPKKSINHLQLIKSKLFDNQYVVLVQVLAQLYLSASGVPALWPPVLDVNSCLNLPESDAIRNPTSYAYYAASKDPCSSANTA